MENPIPSIARGDSSAEMHACEKRRQPDSSPTRMSAISPPSSNAAKIHSTTGGRLRINPGGGSFCCANSSASVSLSSAGRRSPDAAALATGGRCGSSLNLRGTVMMLAPKKSGRQANTGSSDGGPQIHLASTSKSAERKNLVCSNLALARQNSNQRECHDCTSEDCQNYPAPQPRVRFREGK